MLFSTLILWIHRFLMDSTQYVKCNGTKLNVIVINTIGLMKVIIHHFSSTWKYFSSKLAKTCTFHRWQAEHKSPCSMWKSAFGHEICYCFYICVYTKCDCKQQNQTLTHPDLHFVLILRLKILPGVLGYSASLLPHMI